MAEFTLTYPVRFNNRRLETLMSVKQRKVGRGCWFGYGGNIEVGQTPKESACDEVKEECNLIVRPEDLISVGRVQFYKGTEEKAPFGKPTFDVHLYITSRFRGRQVSTDEMKYPTWFGIDDLPYAEMMPGDSLILKYILRRISVSGYIRHTEDERKVLSSNIMPYSHTPF